MKLKPQILFDLLILLFFVYLVWEAQEWKLQARLYPWVAPSFEYHCYLLNNSHNPWLFHIQGE